jgi:hypothetical protein
MEPLLRPSYDGYDSQCYCAVFHDEAQGGNHELETLFYRLHCVVFCDILP